MFSLNGSHGGIYIQHSLFKDGQPHIKIPHIKEVPINDSVIFGRITNSDDLLYLQLIVDVLKANNRENIRLNLSYLIGGRMDREISYCEPSTLRVICNTINSLGFKSITLYDCHSLVSQTLLRAKNVLPDQLFYTIEKEKPVLIIPDAGGQHRVDAMNRNINCDTVQCLKTRNPKTQELSNFIICQPEKVVDKDCLIVDDICDGGRTFVGLAEILYNHGAKNVDLFVTHGIFSYGFNLKGLRHIYTTNSYRDASTYPKDPKLTVFSAPYTPIPQPAEQGSI